MPFSVRLDTETERRVARMAEATGRTKSQVVREAVAAYEIGRAPEPAAQDARHRLGRFIGVARGGDPGLSRQSGAAVRRLLEARRARRSR